MTTFRGPMRPAGENEIGVFEQGVSIMTIEVRFTGCLCSDSACEVRSELVKALGDGDLGAVSLSVVAPDDMPPTLAMAAWEAVAGAADLARTEVAQQAIRDQLAAGFGGT